VTIKTSWQKLIRSEPMRLLQLILGGFLMIIAPVIGIPTPGPAGIFIFAFGLALVLRNSRYAKRRYLHWTRRSPRIRGAVDFGLRRKRRRLPKAAVAERAGGRKGWWRRQRLEEAQDRKA
jgi:hypothetical protein